MRLISLRLHQWRSYEDCSIEFPDGLIGVCGPNGAGKSTIAEAIGWALFGKRRARAKVAELRRQGAPKGAKSFVELEFQLGSSNYRVERLVGGDASLWINGQLETQKATDTNARLAQELDLRWEVFHRSVFAQQKDVAALDPGATSEQRKAHVERLLGLERFKNAASRARSDAKVLSAELDGLRQLAPDPAEIEQNLREVETRAAEGDPAVAAAKEALDEATRLRDDARGALDAEERRASQFELLKQEEETRREGIEDTKNALKGLAERLAERKVQAERLTAFTPELESLGSAQTTLAKWDDLDEVTREVAELAQQLSTLGYDEKHASAEQARLNELNDERARLLASRPEAANAAEQSAARLKALEDVKTVGSIDERQAAVAEAEAALASMQEQLTIARAALEHDREHLREVEEGGPETPCPVCHKPYGDEYGEILSGYRSRIATNTKLVPKLESRNERAQAALEGARRLREQARRVADHLAETSGAGDLPTAAKVLAEAQVKLDGLVKHLAELDAEIPTLSKVCKQYQKVAPRWQELSAMQKVQTRRLTTTMKALGVAAYDADAHGEARGQCDRLALLHDEAHTLKEKLADVPHLEREQKNTAERLKQTQAKLKETKGGLAELAFDPSSLEKLKAEAENRDKQRDAAQARLTTTKLEAQQKSQEVQALRERLAAAKKAQTAIAAKALAARQHEVAADVLSSYRNEQARRAWPRLEQIASALLNAATDGRYVDVKLSDDYRLSIADRGEEHDLARFSGGEQDLANLCLRLAIADWVSKERDVDLGFVILDEVFGSQDEERRQRLLGELRALSNRFRQMLVITHLPEIAELCDAQLEVSLGEIGRSIARVV